MSETASPFAQPLPCLALATGGPQAAPVAVSPPPRKKRIRRVDQTTLVHRDQRTREARLARKINAELLAGLPVPPSPAQAMIIESVVALRLHCERLDQKAVEDGGLSESDRKSYLGFRNALVRYLTRLGLKGAVDDAPDLDDLMAEAARAREAEQR